MKNLLLFCVLCISVPPTAQADVLVLVHGYASNASAWQRSGVNRVLASNGWQRAGIPGIKPAGDRTFYAVELPAAAPLMTQTKYLLDFLQLVRQRHVNESLTLAGHSAGGVVARLALLRGNVANISQLITIASPHLGTPRAVQGLSVVDDKPFFCPGPGFDFMKSIVGGRDYRYLRDSRGTLHDLLPANYDNLLNWANQQPYPAIRYHAIVRQQGDELVPAYSQDLSRLPALNGKVKIWSVQAGHALNRYDGELLVSILSAPDS